MNLQAEALGKFSSVKNIRSGLSRSRSGQVLPGRQWKKRVTNIYLGDRTGWRCRFRNHQAWAVDEALALGEILRERPRVKNKKDLVGRRGKGNHWNEATQVDSPFKSLTGIEIVGNHLLVMLAPRVCGDQTESLSRAQHQYQI